MKKVYLIISLISFAFAIYSFIGTIILLEMKVSYDDIKANGTEYDGLIVAINSKSKSKKEIRIQFNDTIVSKSLSDSEFYYEKGDSVQIYHYSIYPKKYIIYTRIELFQIFALLTLAVLFSLPIVIYCRVRRRINSR